MVLHKNVFFQFKQCYYFNNFLKFNCRFSKLSVLFLTVKIILELDNYLILNISKCYCKAHVDVFFQRPSSSCMFINFKCAGCTLKLNIHQIFDTSPHTKNEQ